MYIEDERIISLMNRIILVCLILALFTIFIVFLGMKGTLDMALAFGSMNITFFLIIGITAFRLRKRFKDAEKHDRRN